MKGFLKSQAPCWLHAHRVLIRQIDKLPKFDLLYFFTQKKIYIYIYIYVRSQFVTQIQMNWVISPMSPIQ